MPGYMNSAWVLKQRPGGDFDGSELALVERPVPDLQEGEILVRNLYLSLDPTNRVWMSDREQYLPPVQIGDTMRGNTIAVVESSRSERFKAGDLVSVGDGGWQTYAVCNAKAAGRVRPVEGVPLSSHLSVLGMTGMTAYFGLMDVCRPASGETLVVSAAAGAVGSVVGQIARLKGCRVIGIAGGEAKCDWIRNDLGFHDAIDYRNEDVGAALDRIAPDGIDISFENVGGSIMDAVYARLRLFGRMAVCGLISTYNSGGAVAGPSDFSKILMQRLTIRGFVVIDYVPRFREATQELGQWAASGAIKWKDHIVPGLESAPDALKMLFSGANDGKLIVKISDES